MESKENLAEEFLKSCCEGNLEGVRAALESGVDVNVRDTHESGQARGMNLADGKTGLIWAVMKNHNMVVKLLLGTPGIDINAKDIKEGMTALHAAVPHHFTDNNINPEGLALLLARQDLEVNHRDRFEENTPLWHAVKFGAIECVQLLLNDPRVDPNVQSQLCGSGLSEYNLTPLMYAVKKSNEAAVLVPLLLNNPRVSLNIKDENDWNSTPLMHAVRENKRNIVELLLADSRSDLDTRDSYKWKADDAKMMTKIERSLEEAARYLGSKLWRYIWRGFSMSFFAGTLVSQDTPNAHVGVGMDILNWRN